MTKQVTLSAQFVTIFVAMCALCGAVELTTNGGFESGDFTGWTQFPSGADQQTVDTANPATGQFSGKIFNNVSTSNSFIRQVNLGADLVEQNESITISFDARGLFGIGGVAFAELFYEIAGGGVSQTLILGGGPLVMNADPEVWTPFSFTQTLDSDVSGGVTFQFGATNGAVLDESTTVWLDNLSVATEGGMTVDGDFDDNGVFNCLDVDSLVSAIASASNDAAFDLSNDGSVNLTDLDLWLAEAGAANLVSGNAYLPGDANLDGSVDGDDFTIWSENKFTSVAAWCSGDFDADGSIGGQDFLTWNANKFSSAITSNIAAPEASGLAPLIIALLCLRRWFCRR